MHGLTYRECCYTCSFAQQKRAGDITLGDFWGLGRHGLPFSHSIEHGVNLILVNHVNGKKLLEMVSDRCFMEERPIEEALKEQTTLKNPSEPHIGRDNFLKEFRSGAGRFEIAVRNSMPYELGKEFIRNATRLRKINRLKSGIKSVLGENLVNFIKTIKHSGSENNDSAY